MDLMRKLSLAKKDEVLRAYRSDITIRTLANKTGVSVFSVLKILRENNIFKPALKKGAKKKLSLRKETLITRKFIDKEFLLASDASSWVSESFGISVSPETIRRTLKNNGLSSKKKIKKPCITPKQAKARLAFAKKHLHWDYFDWKKIIFSDESKYNLHGSDGNKRVWCKKGTELKPENIQSTKKFGGGNVMVWGCITSKGVGKILKVTNRINSQQYCDTLLNGLVSTYDLKNMRPSEYIFQQDNASCHKAASTMSWFRSHNIPTLEWPANSPDLNPIENAWEYLNKKLRVKKSSFSKPDEIWKILEEEWFKIPESYINNLYFSMSARMKAVIAAKGYATKY